MGFPKDRLLVPAYPLLLCPLCSDVYRKPSVICQNCHMLCKDCISLVPACVVCHAEIDHRVDDHPVDVNIDRLIQSLEMHCPQNGCQWTGPISAEEAHVESCDYSYSTCPYKDCSREVLKRDYEAHSIDCEHALRPCVNSPACTYMSNRLDSLEHASMCEWNPCPWESKDGCSFKGTVIALAEHQNYCTKLHEELDTLRGRVADLEQCALNLPSGLTPRSNAEKSVSTNEIEVRDGACAEPELESASVPPPTEQSRTSSLLSEAQVESMILDALLSTSSSPQLDSSKSPVGVSTTLSSSSPERPLSATELSLGACESSSKSGSNALLAHKMSELRAITTRHEDATGAIAVLPPLPEKLTWVEPICPEAHPSQTKKRSEAPSSSAPAPSTDNSSSARLPKPRLGSTPSIPPPKKRRADSQPPNGSLVSPRKRVRIMEPHEEEQMQLHIPRSIGPVAEKRTRSVSGPGSGSGTQRGRGREPGFGSTKGRDRETTASASREWVKRDRSAPASSSFAARPARAQPIHRSAPRIQPRCYPENNGEMRPVVSTASGAMTPPADNTDDDELIVTEIGSPERAPPLASTASVVGPTSNQPLTGDLPCSKPGESVRVRAHAKVVASRHKSASRVASDAAEVTISHEAPIIVTGYPTPPSDPVPQPLPTSSSTENIDENVSADLPSLNPITYSQLSDLALPLFHPHPVSSYQHAELLEGFSSGAASQRRDANIAIDESLGVDPAHLHGTSTSTLADRVSANDRLASLAFMSFSPALDTGDTAFVNPALGDESLDTASYLW